MATPSSGWRQDPDFLRLSLIPGPKAAYRSDQTNRAAAQIPNARGRRRVSANASQNVDIEQRDKTINDYNDREATRIQMLHDSVERMKVTIQTNLLKPVKEDPAGAYEELAAVRRLQSFFNVDGPKRWDPLWESELSRVDTANPGRGSNLWWLFSIHRKRKDLRMVALVPYETLTSAQAQRIMDELCSMVNSYEGTIDQVTSNRGNLTKEPPYVQIMLWIAKNKLGMSTRRRYLAPRLATETWGKERKVQPCISYAFVVFNPTTHKAEQVCETLVTGTHGRYSNNSNMTSDVPYSPNIQWTKFSTRSQKQHERQSYAITQDSDGLDVHESAIPLDHNPEAERRTLCQLEALARAIICRLDGSVMTLKTARVCSANLKQLWTKNSQWQLNKTLFLLHRKPGRVTVDPSLYARSLIQHGTLPSLPVPTEERARILLPLQSISDGFHTHGDIRKSWHAAIDVVERLKQDIGNDTPSPFMCNNEASPCQLFHHCGDCLALVLCQGMKFGSWGYLLCASCFAKEGNTASQLGFSTTWYITDRLNKLFTSECRTRNPESTPTEQDAILTRITAEASASGTNSRKYTNAYTSRIQEMPMNRYAGATLSNPSVDAVHGYVLVNGFPWQHGPGNVAVTSLGLNLIKQAYNLHWLAAVQWYLKSLAQLPSSPTDARHTALEAAIINEGNLARKSRIKTKLCREAQVQNPSLARYELDAQEFRSGRMRSLKGPWDEKTYAYHRLADWTKPELVALKKLLGLLEREFSVTLPKSKDGCPWFTNQLPNNWCWTLAARVMEYRFNLLYHACNEYDVTIDTRCTLFLELIFVMCVRRSQPQVWDKPEYVWTLTQKAEWRVKYQEFLSLPMVLDGRSPLKLSIGHRIHGLPMASGWTSSNPDGIPTCLTDRHDSENNLLPETFISNMGKLNADSRYYEPLKQEILALNIPKQWYDRSIKLDIDTQADLDQHLSGLNTGKILEEDFDDVPVSDKRPFDSEMPIADLVEGKTDEIEDFANIESFELPDLGSTASDDLPKRHDYRAQGLAQYEDDMKHIKSINPEHWIHPRVQELVARLEIFAGRGEGFNYKNTFRQLEAFLGKKNASFLSPENDLLPDLRDKIIMHVKDRFAVDWAEEYVQMYITELWKYSTDRNPGGFKLASENLYTHLWNINEERMFNVVQLEDPAEILSQTSRTAPPETILAPPLPNNFPTRLLGSAGPEHTESGEINGAQCGAFALSQALNNINHPVSVDEVLEVFRAGLDSPLSQRWNALVKQHKEANATTPWLLDPAYKPWEMKWFTGEQMAMAAAAYGRCLVVIDWQNAGTAVRVYSPPGALSTSNSEDNLYLHNKSNFHWESVGPKGRYVVAPQSPGRGLAGAVRSPKAANLSPAQSKFRLLGSPPLVSSQSPSLRPLEGEPSIAELLDSGGDFEERPRDFVVAQLRQRTARLVSIKLRMYHLDIPKQHRVVRLWHLAENGDLKRWEASKDDLLSYMERCQATNTWDWDA